METYSRLLRTIEIVFLMILWNRLFFVFWASWAGIPQFRNSFSDDFVEPTFFCFFGKLGGDSPILWETDKKYSV